MASDEPNDGDHNIEELDPRFPSGNWKGYFVQGGMQYRMTVEVTFQEGRVSGNGADVVGRFRIVGTYNLDAGRVTLRKHYLGQHMVAYDGDCGHNRSLHGRWDIRCHHLFGDWRLWPVNESEEEWELERAEVHTSAGLIVFTDWSGFEQQVQELIRHAK